MFPSYPIFILMGGWGGGRRAEAAPAEGGRREGLGPRAWAWQAGRPGQGGPGTRAVGYRGLELGARTG